MPAMQEFISHPITQLAGWLVGIASLLLSIYFWQNQRQLWKLTYDVSNLIILAPTEIGGVRITANYSGHASNCLTQSVFLIRNRGNQAITKENIPNGIQFSSEGTILGGQVVAADSPQCNILYQNEGPRHGRIVFDYLRPGEGMVIALLHTDPALFLDFLADGPRLKGMQYKRVRRPNQIIAVISSLLSAVLFGGLLALLYKMIALGGSYEIKSTSLFAILFLAINLGLSSWYFLRSTAVRTTRSEKKFLELARN